MLYDPKWEKKPSLAGFIAWLQTKNQKESYDWSNHVTCACGQYYRSLGIVDATQWMHGPLDRIAYGAGGGRWTFGHCLERAKAALEVS